VLSVPPLDLAYYSDRARIGDLGKLPPDFRSCN
jgi:hypothetical protein